MGLVSWLDVLINAQSAALHEAAAEIRAGASYCLYEHVIERSLYGRPYGPPHTLLAYEAAYDLGCDLLG
jgi:hypothetical protein